ncbi:MAG: sialate O-acetylesterase [Asticcacaulis sp.]
MTASRPVSLKILLLSLTALTLPVASQAAPRFAQIFGDNSVLQRDTPVTVWGFADANEAVTLTIGTQTVAAKADATGRWEATLSPLATGTTYELSLQNGPTLKNIVAGDVFLCSGQSNMEFQTRYATNARNVMRDSANNNIRFVTLNRDARPTGPLTDLEYKPDWKIAAPDTTGDSSAVCYFMSRAIHAKTGVPVGMIHSSWGGTAAQAWISQEGLAQTGNYARSLEVLSLYASDPNKAQSQWRDLIVNWWNEHEPDASIKRQWSRPDFDDRDWTSVVPTTQWENWGVPEFAFFDGVVWFRNHVTLTRAQAENAVSIEIGAVDEADTTYVNGTPVGATTSWNRSRVYDLPKGVLKAGKNVVAIRAFDGAGGGGLWGPVDARAIILKDGTRVTLPAEWRYKVSSHLTGIKATLPIMPWLDTSGLSPLYNGMIAPVAPYTLKGVAWYQGESNVYSPREYATLLPTLLADWRTHFRNPDLPFAIVQLANFGPVATEPVASGWAELREVQRQTVNADTNAVMAVSIDFGDRVDIHPSQKKVVGDRLALGLRRIAYGEQVALSPEPTTISRNGPDLTISFSDTQGSLKTYSAAVAIGFETCDAQNLCAYADARVQGDQIILKNAPASTVRVRYAWADSPYINLYSAGDLPVAPFELDIP